MLLLPGEELSFDEGKRYEVLSIKIGNYGNSRDGRRPTIYDIFQA